MAGGIPPLSTAQVCLGRRKKFMVTRSRQFHFFESHRGRRGFQHCADCRPRSHKPNIIDALGNDWFDVKEGEASIFKPEDGKYRLVARVQMEDWPKFVAVK
jgi:hypothetical protein